MKTTFLSIAVLLAAMVLTSSTYAEGRWGHNHPRRAEVNHRLANQNRRIDNKVEDGKMSKGEADKLHHEDHQVRKRYGFSRPWPYYQTGTKNAEPTRESYQ
jgi:hypothetical protein